MEAGGTESFDDILKKRWREAEEAGGMRYKLNISRWKILDGKYEFLAQENINRGEKRRPPQSVSSMNQPFDPDRFNFAKLKPEEILMDLKKDGQDIIAVNNSPLEMYHSLLIPQRSECLPQVATEYSVENAIGLFSLSDSPDLRVAFNSLCGQASVNHLHWHLYYLARRMPLEHIELKPLCGPVHLLEDYPATGFCLKLSSFVNQRELVSWTHLLLNHLQSKEIAHNVYVTRTADTDRDLRVYIWARKSSFGVKDTIALVPAACEFFGHLSIHARDAYEDLTEDTIVEFLRSSTEGAFDRAKAEFVELIGKYQAKRV